jgi:hypothetical protein
MGYSVRDAYKLLTSQDFVTLGETEDLLWHRQVPLKVSIFAWRLLRDRLTTKTNLVSRGIETAQHLFLSQITSPSSFSQLVASVLGGSFYRSFVLLVFG